MAYSHPPHRRYVGSIVDTDRWQHYDPRDGDVFVCTPPKCGTTWTQTIVTMLLAGSTDVIPQRVVQWVDAKVVPVADMVAGLTGVAGRRCIKTHTPFDGIPWVRGARYVAVYRHPVDVLLSLRKHLLNAHDTPPDHPYLGSEPAAFESFVTSPLDPDDFDFDCLATLLVHYRSFVARPQPDNLLVLHYADMLADARGSIERIADHVGVAASPAFLDDIFVATAFDKMKSQAHRFAPFADLGYWRDPGDFFDAAGTRKWAGRLDDAAIALYRDTIARALEPEQVVWLENGDGDG